MKKNKNGFGIHHIADNILQSAGMGILGTFALMIFIFISKTIPSAGVKDLLQIGISLFPYYLLVAFSLLIMLTDIGTYLTYFAIYLSMGLTRKKATGILVVEEAVLILIPIITSGIIWSVQKDDIAQSGLKLLPMLSLVMVIIISVVSMLSALCVKSKIFSIILGMTMGAIAAFGTGIIVGYDSFETLKAVIFEIIKSSSGAMYLVSIFIFVIKSFVQYIIVRKAQVEF